MPPANGQSSRERIRSCDIALCGYGEHEVLENHGWSRHDWEACGGYGIQGEDDGLGNVNKSRERIYFSPYCVKEQDGLFTGIIADIEAGK